MELPSRQSLALLAPDKSKQNIIAPMRQIKNSIAEDRDTRALMRRNTTYYSQAPIALKTRAFAPAGQSTQMIIGAAPEIRLPNTDPFQRPVPHTFVEARVLQRLLARER